MSKPETPPQGTRVSVIDIGSNSIRQAVAELFADKRVRILNEFKVTPRLSRGLETTGLLPGDAMEAAEAAVRRMISTAKRLGVEHTRVVATSAVREAGNGEEFTRRIAAIAGAPVRILSGEEEALLCYRSAQAHFDFSSGSWAVVDLGGGSLELVLSNNGHVEQVASLPCGAVRLTERYLQPGPGIPALEMLRKNVSAEISRIITASRWQACEIVGSGGAFTSLARMISARRPGAAESDKATPGEAARVTRDELESLLDQLHRLSLEELLRVPGLNRSRADIIVAGLAVIAEVAACFNAPGVVASAHGIREGLLLEAADQISAFPHG